MDSPAPLVLARGDVTVVATTQRQVLLGAAIEPEPVAVSGLSPAALQVWEEGFTKVDQGFSVEDELLKQIRLTKTNVSTPYLLLATCYLLLATYMPVTILTTCYWLY